MKKYPLISKKSQKIEKPVRARHCVVASLDRSSCARSATVPAVYDVQTCGRVTRQGGVGTFAHFTGHELLDVFPQQALGMLRKVPAFEDQLAITCHGTFRAELCEHKVSDVVGGSIHHVTDLCEIDPANLL